MPDIGVLNIQIHDDSKKAASGLETLKTKLDNLKSTAEGYDLSNVAGQIKAIVDVAKFDGNVKMGSAIKNLGTFLNSITALSKVKKLQIDVKPIEELKTAIGEGFNLGAAGTQLKQMHEALNMEWNVANARTARDSMKALAAGIREMDGVNATKTIKGAAEALSEYNKALGEVTLAEKEYNKVLGRYTGPAHPGGMSLNLQQFAEAAGGNWRDQMGGIVQQIEEVAQKSEKAKAASGDLNELVETLKQMRLTTADGLNLDVIVTNLERIKEVTSGGIGLTSAANGIQKLNTSAQEALANGTVDVLNNIATALGNIKAQSDGMNLQNVKITFGVGRGGGRSKSADVDETTTAISHVAEAVNDTFTQIETKVESVSSVVVETSEQIMGIANAIEAVGSAETALSTYVENFRPDWIFADQTYIDEYTAKIDKLREVWQRLGPVSEDNMLSTHVESYSPNWVFADQQVLDDYIAKVNAMREAWDKYGPVAEGNMLSTNVESFTPDWVYADQEVFDEYIAKINEMRDAWEKYGPVAEENMLSTHVDFYNPDWVMVDDQDAITTAIEKDTDSARSVLDDFKHQVREGQEEWFNSEQWGAKSLDQTNAMAEKLSELDLLKAKLTEAQEKYNQLVNDEGPGAAKTVKAGLVVRDLKDQIDEYLRSLDRIGLQQTNAMAEAVTPLDLLKAKLEEAQELYNRLVNEEGGSPTSSKSVKAALDIQKLEEQIDEYLGKLKEAEVAERRMQTENTFSIGQTNEMAQSITELDIYKAKYMDAQETFNKLVNELGMSDAKTLQAGMAMNELGEHIREVEEASSQTKGAIRELLESMEETMFGAEGLRGAFKRMFPVLSGMLSRFKNIAKYRFLRSVLKQITSGAKEGLENVYRYSQIVGTSFAPAMDSAASALAQMKNSVGAALAPVLQAIIPILNNIVNAFINVINVANQFFALLGGQTSWTRAITQTTTAYDDLKKSAKGAGGAAKDLLADWDELNIIQSTGGGGGSGKAIPDYENMFEQVYEFDDKIQEVMDVIKNGFGDAWGLVKRIALAILGWKVSKAFGGFIGKLGSLLAGGMLMDIGLEFSFGSSFNAGKKGYFDGVDLLGTVGGIIASAIGGSLITTALGLGSGVGLVIGLTAGIVVSIAGYYMGQQDALDESKWGDVSWTAEQIDKHVKDQFTFDVDAEIEVMKAHIANETAAKEEVDKAFDEFDKSYTEAKHIVFDIDNVDAETKINAVRRAADDARSAINAMQNLIDTNTEGIKYTLTNFKFIDAEGNDITENLITSLTNADATLKEYLHGFGEELSKTILEGEKSGWKNGEAEAALALMETQSNIQRRASELLTSMDYEATAKAGLKNVIDRETAYKEKERQEELLAEYKKTAEELVNKEYEDLIFKAAYAQAAYEELIASGKDGSEMREAAETYKKAAETLMANFDDAVEAKLKDSKERMAKEWADVLREVYGQDYEKIVENALGNYGFYDAPSALETVLNPFGMESYLSPEGFKKHGVPITAQKLRQNLVDYFIANDYGEVHAHLLESLGGNPFYLLTEDLKKMIMNKLYEATGDIGLAQEIFKQAFSITDSDAQHYADECVKEQAKTVEEAVETAAGNFDWDEYIKQYTAQDYIPKDVSVELPETVKVTTNKNAQFDDDEELHIWDLLEDAKAPIGNVHVYDDAIITALMESYHENALNADKISDILGEFDIPIDDIIKFVDYSDLFDDDIIRQEILDALERAKEKIGDVDGRGSVMDPNYVAKNLVKSGRIAGSAGMSDVGYSAYGASAPADTSASREYNREDIAAGVSRGNGDVVSALNQLVALAQAINRKDFTVKIGGTSAFGATAVAGISALNKVTG